MLPFEPQTETAAITVGTAASSVQAPALAGGVAGSQSQYLLTNVGSQVVWVSVVGAAAIPVPGTNTASFPITAGTQSILTLPTGATLSVIAAATGSTLYVTQGSVR